MDIPFARALADLSNPASVRLRRDFGLLLNLIKAHAILHQLSREQNAKGEIIASIDDYAGTVGEWGGGRRKEEGRGRRKVKERARPKHNEEHSEMQ